MSAVKAQTDLSTRPPLHVVPPPADRRRTLPDRVGYALAASVIGLGLFASVTPSPLYHAYSELWHFSPLTLTLIYATYAFGGSASASSSPPRSSKSAGNRAFCPTPCCWSSPRSRSRASIGCPSRCSSARASG